MNLLRQILTDIQKLEESEREWIDSDIRFSFTGVKRYIYGIWHEGYNELGQCMICHMNDDLQEFYYKMIEAYSEEEEIKVHFPLDDF